MNSTSSYRIGSRASEANHYAASSESSILRSLFDLRKSFCSSSCGRPNDCSRSEKFHLTFWNCRWSPRILHSLRKILERDGRTFDSIKFFDCAIQRTEENTETSSGESEDLFLELLKMILANNSTNVLVIRGGQLIGSRMAAASQHQQQHRVSCELCCDSSSCCSSGVSLATVLKNGLSTSTSLTSLKMSGLKFSTGAFDGLIKNKTLHRLDISGSELSSTLNGLSDALSENTTLQHVRLYQCSLDDQSLAQLVRSIYRHPSLTTLDLSKNYLGARNNNTASSTVALDAITELLQSNESKLACLNLSHQYQNYPTTMTTTSTTTETHGKNSAEEEQEQHKAAFGRSLEALSTNTNLKKIDLSGNFGCLQDDASVGALGKCLRSNRSLEYVDVSGCGMTPEGMACLGREYIPVFGASLKALVLFNSTTSTIQEPQQQQRPPGCPYALVRDAEERDSYCCDYHVAALALQEGLSSNITIENLGNLRSLYINSRNDDDEKNTTLRRTCSRIEQTLNLNRGGRRVLAESYDNDSHLSVGVWSHLLARAGNVDYFYNNNTNKQGHSEQSIQAPASVVFALLRQGPVLLED